MAAMADVSLLSVGDGVGVGDSSLSTSGVGDENATMATASAVDLPPPSIPSSSLTPEQIEALDERQMWTFYAQVIKSLEAIRGG